MTIRLGSIDCGDCHYVDLGAQISEDGKKWYEAADVETKEFPWQDGGKSAAKTYKIMQSIDLATAYADLRGVIAAYRKRYGKIEGYAEAPQADYFYNYGKRSKKARAL